MAWKTIHLNRELTFQWSLWVLSSFAGELGSSPAESSQMVVKSRKRNGLELGGEEGEERRH